MKHSQFKISKLATSVLVISLTVNTFTPNYGYGVASGLQLSPNKELKIEKALNTSLLKIDRSPTAEAAPEGEDSITIYSEKLSDNRIANLANEIEKFITEYNRKNPDVQWDSFANNILKADLENLAETQKIHRDRLSRVNVSERPDGSGISKKELENSKLNENANKIADYILSMRRFWILLDTDAADFAITNLLIRFIEEPQNRRAIAMIFSFLTSQKLGDAQAIKIEKNQTPWYNMVIDSTIVGVIAAFTYPNLKKFFGNRNQRALVAAGRNQKSNSPANQPLRLTFSKPKTGFGRFSNLQSWIPKHFIENLANLPTKEKLALAFSIGAVGSTWGVADTMLARKNALWMKDYSILPKDELVSTSGNFMALKLMCAIDDLETQVKDAHYDNNSLYQAHSMELNNLVSEYMSIRMITNLLGAPIKMPLYTKLRFGSASYTIDQNSGTVKFRREFSGEMPINETISCKRFIKPSAGTIGENYFMLGLDSSVTQLYSISNNLIANRAYAAIINNISNIFQIMTNNVSSASTDEIKALDSLKVFNPNYDNLPEFAKSSEIKLKTIINERISQYDILAQNILVEKLVDSSLNGFDLVNYFLSILEKTRNQNHPNNVRNFEIKNPSDFFEEKKGQ